MAYPALTEMGITNPEEIERYSLQTVNNVDILRIIYKRKKGTFRASSKKYRFGRAQKMVVSDSGKHETQLVHEISPFVLKATDELRQIVKGKHSRVDQIALIMEEITRLEEETHSRLAYLKTLIAKCE